MVYRLPGCIYPALCPNGKPFQVGLRSFKGFFALPDASYSVGNDTEQGTVFGSANGCCQDCKYLDQICKSCVYGPAGGRMNKHGNPDASHQAYPRTNRRSPANVTFPANNNAVN